jgi:hypothetical protein
MTNFLSTGDCYHAPNQVAVKTGVKGVKKTSGCGGGETRRGARWKGRYIGIEQKQTVRD